MSGRGLTDGVKAELGQPLNRPCHLYAFDFNPWIYLTDAAVDVAYNGNTYLSAQVLGFSGIAETSDLLVNTCTVTLTGVDQAVVARLLQESYLNRKVRIYKTLLDASLQPIANPGLIFDGRMNKPTISIDVDNGATVCAVDCVSHWKDYERRPGRHSNDTEQQTHFPGDRGFAQVASLPDEIFWGINQVLGGQLGPGVRLPWPFR